MTANESIGSAMELHPLGVVKSGIQNPVLSAGEEGLELTERMEKIREEHRKIQSMISELVIDPAMEEISEGIEDFSHILVLYWPHLIPPERRRLRQVHPMGRKDVPLQGIFATCSPARPNPILVSAVRLLERKGNVLRVQGFEAVDGSPVLDIKPYVTSYYGVENPKVSEWMQKIQKELEDDPI